MAERADVADDLLACGGRIGSLAGNGGETPRLALQPLDALEKMKRAQRGRRMHAGINQHESRDDDAVLIFLQKIQSEIDQRQEHEVGQESIGVAQEQHACAPLGLATPNCGEPAGINGPTVRSLYANDETAANQPAPGLEGITLRVIADTRTPS
jgi:hypothetical protein